MDNDKLIKALRAESRYSAKATREIMDLCMAAMDLCTVAGDVLERMQAQLAEKDKQIAAAVAKLSLAENFIHYVGPDAMEAYRTFNGPQEAGEGGG